LSSENGGGEQKANRKKGKKTHAPKKVERGIFAGKVKRSPPKLECQDAWAHYGTPMSDQGSEEDLGTRKEKA